MRNLKNKRILVSGAGGFIGSHLCERLVEVGALVRAIIHYNSMGSNGWLDYSSHKNDIEILYGDILDNDFLNNALDNIDIVFHLAALISIPYSYIAPQLYINNNVLGTLNMLRSARNFNIERFIHTSTSEVYGTAKYTPIDENHPLQGQSPYSASKIGADKIAESFFCSFNMPIVIIRPFNTFGPRQSTRAIIPTIINQIATCKSIELGDLIPTRDFNYVSNTVDAFILAALNKMAVGESINIGSGNEVSIRELTNIISNKLGKKIKIKKINKRIRPRKSEVYRLIADNTKAKEILGWEPKIDLSLGIEKTIEWYLENIEKFNPKEYRI